MTFTITRIDTAERHRVTALAERIWPECFAGIIDAERIPHMVAEIYAPDTLRADIEQRGHVYWLAQVDGEDAGYVSGFIEGDRLWLKKLYTLDSVRGRGLGKALMQTVRDHFSGAKTLSLYVYSLNAPAIAFYQSRGFTIEAKVPVQMGPYRFEDYIMNLDLTKSDRA
ncbi:GNAT family N-acetyltransferase [Asticcacaulis sp. BYS171W]|uniref:GNAT family N-acetyltransferase n=1 Tax=Asticcacaulis aquaticus TaxID=2984212 RepID=A0ABT5HQW8_9CAUL|nr:GNAT family N-acetyltransferase [Asticcacaulis aquaticus]MDC7682465.1 GNAT family N-acetyltransferase [Asticcacaulis aquaticus]